MVNNATLQELRVNGLRVPDFNPAKTEYTYTLGVRHRPSTMPVIQFKAISESAATKLTTDTKIPGSARICVTADDGTTQTYTLHFVKSEVPEKHSYITSWVGNTFSGEGNVQDGKWVQNCIEAMVVMPDGTCYTKSGWDEAGRTHGIYKDGDCIGNKDMNIDATKVTDRSGNIWAIVEGNIVKEGTDIVISAIGKPAALAIANDGTLMVADNARHQILFFDISVDSPVEVKAFGELGGMASDTSGVPKGRIIPTRFWEMTGIGMDKKGNIYVSMNFLYTTCAIRCLTPEGEQLWQIESASFLDCFDFDPTTDGRDIYGVTEHYEMDYSQAPGKEQKLVAYTLDTDKYPNDPRALMGGFHLATVWIRYIDGQKFMFSTGMFPNGVYIWRFEEEIAVPCGIIARHFLKDENGNSIPNQPNGPYIWRDLNGNGDFEADEFTSIELGGDYGWDVDDSGNIWKHIGNGNVAVFKVSGLDEHGSPIYTPENKAVYHFLDKLDPVRRMQYDAKTDSLYIGGYDLDDPYEGHMWGSFRTIYRYDNVTTGKLTLHKNYPIRLAYFHYDSEDFSGQAFNINPESFRVEGERIFLIFCARGPLGFKTGEMHVYDSDTTEDVACITPDATVGGFANVGWVDIPQGIRAMRTSDGNYKVLVEEDFKAKQMLYTVTPYNGIPNVEEVSDGDSEFTVSCPRVEGGAVIDGKLDESFWGVQGTLHKQTGSEFVENIVTFGTAWDETYLYIGVNVVDDKVFGTADANFWDNDAIEIFIDGNNDKGGPYDDHDVQYMVAWGKDTLFASGSGKEEGVLWAIQGTDEGYVVEMAVPWVLLDVKPEMGTKIGFDITNDDRVRADGSRAGSLTWAGDVGNFQSTENFGTLVLSDE